MQQNLRVLMAQINPLVGAIDANTDAIISIICSEQPTQDVILFPELALTGYSPEDLLLRDDFHQLVRQALTRIQAATRDCYIILGHPAQDQGFCYNGASVFYQGQCIATYYKQQLPNYDVFDEQRYFTPGPTNPCLLQIKGYTLGLCICEDLWVQSPVDQMIAAGATILLCLNASPFDYQKYALREELLSKHAKRGLSIIYVNLVGGQDELVFDGLSLAMDQQGNICARAPTFKEALHRVVIQGKTLQGLISPLLEENALIYEALVCGTRDYVHKNHFPGVLLGLSGGIDSALTLAIAVDALGADKVHAVMMPSQYTADMSNEDATTQLDILKVSHSTLAIESVFNAFLLTLAPVFTGLKQDVTEENLQARIRGTLLMALSNKLGKMVLTTSNKSESAVGYATLYGDMAGGFSVLKDVLKTQVYALARYRNAISPNIPERVLTRPPSAELAPNQTDQDSLPDYAILDAIIRGYMENDRSAEDLISEGFASDVVHATIKRITRNEYKRRQAAPGVKISTRAFGKDWRYPITSGM
jgi:NAD+ synthase (glutamine-hydrolysing)